MRILRLLTAMLAGACPLLGNPFQEAEQSFLRELNSMEGIELAGGPFRAGEQHHFEGEFGYFVPAPTVVIPTIDQRLSVQTKLVHTVARSNTLPVGTGTYLRDDRLTAADRHQIHLLLAEHGFAPRRDEVTAVDVATIQLRSVQQLSILKTSSTPHASGECVVLLGAQSWQGIPLYRASFDRTRGEFELETLRESFIPRRRHQVGVRTPIFAPQTFFAEAGLTRGDWAKLLRNFATLDLPVVGILEATVSDRLVTVYADTARPVLPQFWVKLEKGETKWKIRQAVEFRAEFPRPGPWWTFLPLLPEKPGADLFPQASVSVSTRREISAILARLRGIGQITSISSEADEAVIRARTRHDELRGYELELKRIENSWRFSSVSEWSERPTVPGRTGNQVQPTRKLMR